MNGEERGWGALRATKRYDEVGCIAEEEADQQAPHDYLRGFETFRDAEEFGYDVDDGSGGQRQEEDKDFGRVKDGPYNGAKEGWAASDESEQDYEFPGDALAR